MRVQCGISFDSFNCAFLPPAYVVRREGTVFTGVSLSTPGEGVPQGRYPQPGQDRGKGIPQGRYPLTKVGTPQAGQDGEGVPQGRYPLTKVGTPQAGQDGEGVPQGRYPLAIVGTPQPAQDGGDRGTPR